MTAGASWVLFNAFVLAMLVLDLAVFHRTAHEVHMKEAMGFSIFWIALSLLFNAFLYYWKGPQQAMEFLTGYLLEKSLSVDNIFVFILIFSYFRVEPRFQHTVLFWGVLGALVMRGIFIAAGVALIRRFVWVVYIFGGFLIFTAIKMAFQSEEPMEMERNPILKLCRRLLPVSRQSNGSKFFIRENGRLLVTPLFIVLVVVEATDIIFATDSIPAILAVSTHPFIIYSSNVFAILGLRALYFAMAGLMGVFHYLKYGLALVLFFIGTKMLVAEFCKIPTGIALGVVGGILGVSILVSILHPPEKN